MTHTSANVAAIEVSAIKAMAMRSAAVEGAASLAWGLPSFRTPVPIRDAVREALQVDADIGKYALPDGLAELRSAIARFHLVKWGVEADPGTEVMVTAGNMQGMNALLHVLIDAGDEVIVTDPGFASHFQQIRLCGGTPVHWTLDEAQDWALQVDALEALITTRTRAIVLVTPSNPTGTIFSRADQLRVAQIAARHGLMILLDDPYSDLTYENQHRYFSLASDPQWRDHVAYLFSFSKSYAMSGWRLGYMVVPHALKREVLKVHDATLICTPRISQVAGLAALHDGGQHLPDFQRILGARRAYTCQRLDRLAHVFDYVRPAGAYYVFPRILVPHHDSWSFALDLLDSAGVTVTPGSGFGPAGEHHVRIAFCVDDEVLEQAFDRLDARFPA